MNDPSATQTRLRNLPWDARIARRLVEPLVDTWVTPNHLTTLRLAIGLASAYAFSLGGYANLGALLLVLSNLADHADGELARMGGRTSRVGHLYDLASDALVTVLLFVGIGAGMAEGPLRGDAVVLGVVAGLAVSAIFCLRMVIEERAGKRATRQPAWGGFEAEDVLYLMPLVTLAGGLQLFLVLAAVGAPLFLIVVVRDFFRVCRPGGAR